MDNKRVLGRLVVPRKGPGVRDKCVKEDENSQFCNRIGCNGRLNHGKGIRSGCSEKTKPETSPSGSPNGKKIVKTTSIVGADIDDRKRALTQRRLHSHLKPVKDGLDGTTEKIGIPNSPTRADRVIGIRNKEIGCGKTKLSAVGSSSVLSNVRPWRKSPAISGNGKQNTSSLPSVSLTPKATGSVTSSRLINVKCSRISDAIPRRPPTKSKVVKRGEVRQRDPDGESSSSGRGKKLSGDLAYDETLPQPNSRISVPDVRSSRRWNSGVTIGPGSLSNGRLSQTNNRITDSTRGKRNNASQGSSTFTISGSRSQTPNSSEVSASCHHKAVGSSSRASSRSTRAGSNVSGSTQSTSMEPGITRFRNRDAFWQYNIDDIAGVLMELERIEQSDDMTYERLHSLETNLFLSSSVFDQHRDMRMDIDNMSYEELLALEERMGTVSTALSEEEITKCLHRSIYQPPSSDEANLGSNQQNGIRCTICQEEYTTGDEIGNLGCEHSYHIPCIENWLRMKNWCPICKGSVAGKDSSS